MFFKTNLPRALMPEKRNRKATHRFIHKDEHETNVYTTTRRSRSNEVIDFIPYRGVCNQTTWIRTMIKNDM